MGHLVSYKNTVSHTVGIQNQSMQGKPPCNEAAVRRAAAWHKADPLTPGYSGRPSA